MNAEHDDRFTEHLRERLAALKPISLFLRLSNRQ